MNAKGSVTVLFIGVLYSLLIIRDCSSCKTNKLEGDSLTLKLADRKLKDDDEFTIKKDNKILLRRSNIKTSTWILKDSFLEHKPLKLSDDGKYEVNSNDVKGIALMGYSETVCVYAKVPKPTVNITCKDLKVDLRCDAGSGKNLSYSWHKNGKEIKKDALQNVPEDNAKYICIVRNPVHNSASDEVEASCYTPPTLFGFDLWIMVGILAGGGALVLILMIVLLTFACRACKRKEKQLRDEEEYRLNYINTSQSNGQKSKQTARGQPAPPEPYDDASAQDVPCQSEHKPRTQQRARPPPPPIDDEEQPPPLPQPRKKSQPKNHER